MRLLSTTIKGMTCFATATTINYAEAGGALVALVGVNGAGKTTAMESAPASLFKRFPTRPGSLYDYCSGTDCYVESLWSDGGREIRVRLVIDAERRKTEGYVYVNGAPVCDGKSAQFEEAIAGLFGDWDLFRASVFAAQDRSGSFLSMKASARKSLFAEMLGLGHLEELATVSRSKGADATNDAGKWQAVIRELTERNAGTNVESLRQRIDQDTVTLKQYKRTLVQYRDEHTAAMQRVAECRAASSSYETLKADVAAKQESLRLSKEGVVAARKNIEDIDANLKAERDALLARNLGEAGEQAKAMYDETVARISERKVAIESTIAAAPDLDEVTARLERLDDEEAQLSADEEAHVALGRARDKAKLERDEVDRNLAAHREKKARLDVAAMLVSEVPCDGETWVDYDRPNLDAPIKMDGGSCPLLKSALEAKGIRDSEQFRHVEETLEAEMLDYESRFKRATDDYHSSQEQASVRAERRKANRDSFAKAQDDRAAARAVDTLKNEISSLATQLDEAHGQMSRRLVELTVQTEKDNAELARISTRRWKALEAAQEELARREQVFAAAGETLLKADVALEDANLAAVALHDAKSDVSAAGKRVEDIEAEVREYQRQLAMMDERITTVADNERSIAQKQRLLDADLQASEDYATLATALGKNGVQALEVDAAAPEISGLANELLESCYGPRFSLTLDTLKARKDGTMRESFEVTVFDGKHPRPVEALSGGERVIVNEALSLAMAIYNARKSNVQWETLWRDETAGALDPANADAYVRMLRKVLDIGGFAQVIFVAHLPAVYESADVQIVLEKGRLQDGKE